LNLKRIVSLSAVVLLAAMCLAPEAAAQENAAPIYFPETGHTVRDPFVEYFKDRGAVAGFGYPITDDFVDPGTGLLVQYFQKARLEWHPGNTPQYQIQLGLLGEELGRRTAPLPVSEIPAPSNPNCRYFTETSHSLCYKFKDYWDTNGGLDLFGYPLSELTVTDSGLMVQDFQRARMEWHPEKPAGQTIQLAGVGEAYFDYAGLPRDLKAPRVDSARFGEVTELHARASVLVPVATGSTTQTGFVFVTDQFGQPIRGAAVTMVARYPAGDQAYTLPPTDASGVTFQDFQTGRVPAGQIVPLKFIVAYPGLQAETRTSYMAGW
jgi:hypothetical protein